MFIPIAATVLGLLLMGLTIFDVFVTVLHPQAESPFSSRIQRGVWQTMRLVSRALPGRSRHRFMGLAVPLMIVGLVATWMIVLLLAYAFIYAAWINAPGAFRVPSGTRNLGWPDALYFSGVTLGTIGYGDLQPVNTFLRMTSIAEGFSGIAVLSMSIAYVLELYPVLQRAHVLAVLLNEESAGQVSGMPMLARYLRSGNFEALADLLRLVNLELLYLAAAHRRLPILHYSHPTEIETAFLRVLLVVRNVVATLRFGLGGETGRKWSEDPRVQDLEDTLFYTLFTLGSSLQLPLASDGGNEARAQALEADFLKLVGLLSALRLPTHSPDTLSRSGTREIDHAQDRYVSFYQASDISVMSYMRNSGYTYNEAIRTAPRPERLVRELEADLQLEAEAQEAGAK